MEILAVGDYDQAVVAHQAFGQANELSARLKVVVVEQVGVDTRDLDPALAADSELKFSRHDDSGEVGLCEISGHRFFIDTAFQPERAALKQCVHPVNGAFIMVAL